MACSLTPKTTPTPSPPYREALLEVIHPGLTRSTRRSQGLACSLTPNTTPTLSPSYCEDLLEVIHPGLPDPPGDLGAGLFTYALHHPYPFTSLP
jgi:hypothetical protein